ncbi:MAG: hypothetical protein SCK70_15320, partial [bacterium]|nr:hypothetical protein [bacterium]
ATPAASEKFSVEILNATAENTSESLGLIFQPALDSLETVVIQTSASLAISQVVLPDTVIASQLEPWRIKVVVVNSGGARAVIDAPKPADITFRVEGQTQNDYIVVPPDELAGGGLMLSSGQSDTLIYRVTNTGENAGSGIVQVNLTAQDQNSRQTLSAQRNQNYYVASTAAVQLVKTMPICPNYNALYDRGYVNRGQQFIVRVYVRNLGRKKVKDVDIKVSAQYGSIIEDSLRTIPTIEHGSLDSMNFHIQADPNFTRINEVFTSEIVSAKEFDTNQPAKIDNSGDNKARVTVQDSARLKLDAHTENHHTVYTINQLFNVEAKVSNIGSPPAQVDSSGSLMIKVPDNYLIVVGEDTLQNNNVVLFYPGVTHRWSILTPEVASGPDTILVSILNVPNDKNVAAPAIVIQNMDTIIVRTEATNLIINSFGVSAPEGAIDNILSTHQEFTVQAHIQYSSNLENVRAGLRLPKGTPYYQFLSPADSIQNVNSLIPVNWRLRAPEVNDTGNRNIYLVITATERGNPQQLVYSDSI